MLNIKALFSKLEARKLLWTNPNPSASFAGQDVAISSLGNFETIEIEFASSAANIRFRYAQSFTAQAMMPAWASIPTYRNATINSTGIHFSDAFEKSQTQNNGLLIPYRIYGIRNLGGVLLNSILKAFTPHREVVGVC